VARLAAARIDGNAGPPPRIEDHATYLMTGGLGDLGLEVARRLVALGARHLALVSRRPADPSHAPALTALREAGAQVVTWAADISEEGQVARVLGEIAASSTLPPLRGVLHLAGVLDDGVLRLQTPERFARVMAPKVRGAWILHRLTQGLDLDLFVLFSSIAAVLGAPGQASYAAANAFLDGLASYRRGRGLPALSIQWGSWAEIGMSARLGLDEQLRRTGEGILPKDDGLAAFAALLGAPPAAGTVAVLPVDWPRYLQRRTVVEPFFAALRPPAAKPSVQAAPFRQRLDEALPARRRPLLEAHVREQLTQILGHDAALQPDAGFFSLGMDSLTSIELRNRLQTSLGCPLGQTLAFDHPTLESLTDHLYRDVLGLSSATPDPPVDAPPALPEPEPPLSAAAVARRLAEKLGLEMFADE
jgi:NAD(P)-dependent dehydrogenase (short-subunit alcohol dehydrogenase family)/acyl carrier protein